jgi:hypothetical protein
MYGAGPDVFAVWAYVIANTHDSQVELNPVMLAATLGTTPNRIESAIAYLCASDPRSRSKVEEGRRLIREGEFAYRVPTFDAYRSIRNEEERRAYNRIKKAEQRQRDKVVKVNVNDSQRKSTLSAHTETETYTEAEAKKTRTNQVFDAIWDAYPKRAGGNPKATALKAFSARLREGVNASDMLAGVERYARYVAATGKVGTEYVKQASTFFGPDRHWDESWDIPATAGDRRATAVTSMLEDWLDGE